MTRYVFYVGRGAPRHREVTVHGKRKTDTYYVPNLTSVHAGSVALTVGRLGAGTQTGKVMLLVRSTPRHGQSKTKALTLTVPFTVC